MKIQISPEIRELIYHILSLDITKYQRIFLDAIKKRGEYDDHERVMLNTIRKQYYKELKEIYISIGHIYGLDVEAELTAMLSQQIAEEIDKEILEKLLKNTQWDIQQ
jgi:hypothetical protein